MLVVALAGPRLSTIEARIASLREQVAPGQVSDLVLPFEERVLAPMAQGFGRRAVQLPARHLPGRHSEIAHSRLGSNMTAITFVTFWAICIGLFSRLGLMAVVAMGGFSAQGLLGLMVMGAIGFLLPRMWLKSAVRSRQRLIVKALPDALDLVTTCVEAGLGLDAALGRVAEQMKGPLAAELSQTLREIWHGAPAPGGAERPGRTHRGAGAHLLCQRRHPGRAVGREHRSGSEGAVGPDADASPAAGRAASPRGGHQDDRFRWSSSSSRPSWW